MATLWNCSTWNILIKDFTRPHEDQQKNLWCPVSLRFFHGESTQLGILEHWRVTYVLSRKSKNDLDNLFRWVFSFWGGARPSWTHWGGKSWVHLWPKDSAKGLKPPKALTFEVPLGWRIWKGLLHRKYIQNTIIAWIYPPTQDAIVTTRMTLHF